MWRWGEAPPHVPAHSGQGLDLACSALVGLLLLISRPPLLAKAHADDPSLIAACHARVEPPAPEPPRPLPTMNADGGGRLPGGGGAGWPAGSPGGGTQLKATGCRGGGGRTRSGRAPPICHGGWGCSGRGGCAGTCAAPYAAASGSGGLRNLAPGTVLQLARLGSSTPSRLGPCGL